jgi:hypothetical protein
MPMMVKTPSAAVGMVRTWDGMSATVTWMIQLDESRDESEKEKGAETNRECDQVLYRTTVHRRDLG